VWENPEDIDLAALPNQFVLKCNHNSSKGYIYMQGQEQDNYQKRGNKSRRIFVRAWMKIII
jgi:hypothetical protein